MMTNQTKPRRSKLTNSLLKNSFISIILSSYKFITPVQPTRTFGKPQINQYTRPSLEPVLPNDKPFDWLADFRQPLSPPQGKYPPPSPIYPKSLARMPKHGTMPTTEFRKEMKKKGLYKKNVNLGQPYIGFKLIKGGINAVGSQYFAGLKRLPQQPQQYYFDQKSTYTYLGSPAPGCDIFYELNQFADIELLRCDPGYWPAGAGNGMIGGFILFFIILVCCFLTCAINVLFKYCREVHKHRKRKGKNRDGNATGGLSNNSSELLEQNNNSTAPIVDDGFTYCVQPEENVNAGGYLVQSQSCDVMNMNGGYVKINTGRTGTNVNTYI